MPSLDAQPSFERRFRDWLRAEGFLAGERIGSERGIAERFSVTRTTLRSVLETLEGEGKIRRAMGPMGGVFAHDGTLQRQVNTTLGVPAIARPRGFEVVTQVRSITSGAASPAEARALRLGDGARVVRIRRVRNVAGESWSYDRSVLPSSRFRGLRTRDLSGSLYDLLRNEFGVCVDHTIETVEGTPATAIAVSAASRPLTGQRCAVG